MTLFIFAHKQDIEHFQLQEQCQLYIIRSTIVSTYLALTTVVRGLILLAVVEADLNTLGLCKLQGLYNCDKGLHQTAPIR